MYKMKKSIIATLALVFTLMISCKDLTELNINPNGVDPANADLNFLFSQRKANTPCPTTAIMQR